MGRICPHTARNGFAEEANNADLSILSFRSSRSPPAPIMISQLIVSLFLSPHVRIHQHHFIPAVLRSWHLYCDTFCRVCRSDGVKSRCLMRRSRRKKKKKTESGGSLDASLVTWVAIVRFLPSRYLCTTIFCSVFRSGDVKSRCLMKRTRRRKRT